MKTKQTKTTLGTLWISILAVSLATLLAGQAHGQIYVSDVSSGTVGDNNLDGTAINSSLITGLTQLTGLALAGNTLYVSTNNDSGTDGTVGTYNATRQALQSLLHWLRDCLHLNAWRFPGIIFIS